MMTHKSLGFIRHFILTSDYFLFKIQYSFNKKKIFKKYYTYKNFVINNFLMKYQLTQNSCR